MITKSLLNSDSLDDILNKANIFEGTLVSLEKDVFWKCKAKMSGCYVFLTDQNYPLYVGRSMRVRERVRQHVKLQETLSKSFMPYVKKVLIFETSRGVEDNLEIYLIRLLKPIFNGTTYSIGYNNHYKDKHKLTDEKMEKILVEWEYPPVCTDNVQKLSSRYEEEFNTEEKGAGGMLEISLSDVVKYMNEGMRDLFILEQLIKFSRGKFSEEDSEIIEESLNSLKERLLDYSEAI